MDKEGILMNWEMKPTSWEMENLVFGGRGGETNHLHNHGHGHGHGHGGEVLFLGGGGEKQQQMKGSSCTVDLQLGRLGDFGDGFGDFKVSTRGTGTSSMAISPGSSRRSRSSNSNNQVAACIVDDCYADLTNCKDYHKRHKVCEAHSKAVKVTVEGHEKRFCQQCSKFHALSEFDEVKRSCRKRLEGHNKRRRKSQPDLSSGSLVHTIQGHGFRSYINQHGLSNAVREHGWAAGFIKPEEDSMYNRQPALQQQQMVATNRPQPFLGSSSSYYKGGGKQFPFLQGSDVKPTAKSLEMFASQTHMSTAASSLESNSINSDCALSLLSSSPQSSGLTLNSIDQIPMALPLVQGVQYSNMDRYHSDKMLPMNCSPHGVPCPMMDVDQVSPMLISNQDNSGYHSQGMVHDMGNSRTGVLQPLHFWQ